jgi:hypothetical protein
MQDKWILSNCEGPSCRTIGHAQKQKGGFGDVAHQQTSGPRILDSMKNVPISFLDGMHLFDIINHDTPFGQITNIQILRPNVATYIINDEMFGCDRKKTNLLYCVCCIVLYSVVVESNH